MPNIAKQQQQEHEARLKEAKELVDSPENSLITIIKSFLKDYIDGKMTGPNFFKWLMDFMVSCGKYYTSESNKAIEYIASIELLWYDMENKKKSYLQEILEGKHCTFYSPGYEG